MKKMLLGLMLVLVAVPLAGGDVPKVWPRAHVYVVDGQYRQDNSYIWVGGLEARRSAYFAYDLSGLFPDNETEFTVNSVTIHGGTYRLGSGDPMIGIYAVEDASWTDATIPFNPPPTQGDLLMSIQPTVSWGSFRQGSTALASFIAARMASADRQAALNVAEIDSWNAANYTAFFDDFKLIIDFTRVRAPKPVLSNGGEGYTSPPTVSITCSDPAATVRYTVDGSDPTPSSPVYSAPFQVTTTTIVKARAWIAGKSRSEMAKMQYRFVPVGTAVTTLVSEDTDVDQNYGGSVFNGAAVSILGNYYGDAKIKSFLKFNVPALAKPAHGRTIINAAIFAWSGGDEPIPINAWDTPPATLYQVADNSWTGTGITWATAPAFGPAIEEFAFPGYLGTQYFDVKAFVQASVDNASTTFSFGADAPNWYVDSTHKNMFRMYTLESNPGYGRQPQLWVDYSFTYDPADNLTITPNGGSFTAPQTVSITGGTEGATIHYTLNGGDPTEADPVYAEPFTVDQTLTVKARAFMAGYAPSAIARADFVLPFTGTMLEVNPTYDVTVVGPPYYQIYDGGNSTLFTGVVYGPAYTYFQFDLSVLPALPDWSTGIRINGVKFTGVAIGKEGGDAANYQDGLYLVTDNDWTNTTISYDYRPATSDLLTTWDFPNTPPIQWFSASGPGLNTAVQAKADSATDKVVSFCMQAMNPPSSTAGDHYYYDKEAYGGGYRLRLHVYYDFIAGPAVENVTISPNGGTFTATQTVTLSTATSGAVIYYTLDGTDPSSSSLVYSDPLTVATTTMIKAKAYATGHYPSAITKKLFTLPTVGTLVNSIAVEDASASYVNLGTNPVMWLGNYSGASVKSFVKFNIPELSKPATGRTIINSAIFTWRGGDEGHTVPVETLPLATLYRVLDNSWTETGVTFATAPAFGSPIEVFAYPGIYNAIEYSVKEYLQEVVDSAGTTISFGAEAPAMYVDEQHVNRFRMYSRETIYTGLEPRLIVDYTIDAPRVEKPVIAPAGGTFAVNPTVTITSATSGAVIRYTQDGSVPSESSALYAAPFTAAGPLTLKAVAFPPSGSTLYKSETATARFEAPVTVYDNPVEIKKATGTITIDGNLTPDWADAEWVQLTVNYDGNPTDVAEAWYAAKWAPDGSKIYVAVKVKDTTHKFTDTYTEWNARDAVEIYLHTNGYSADTSYTNSEAAQEYAVGIKSDTVSVWTDLGYKMDVPAICDFQAAGKEGTDGEWLYYEVAMTPFQYMGGFMGLPSISTPVVEGQVIGLDVVVAASNGTYTGMKSENNWSGKSNNYSQFGVHKLVSGAVRIPGDANSDNKVDVSDLGILAANYGTTSGATWDRGDFNNDGKVDVSDLGILAANYGTGTGGSADFNKDSEALGLSLGEGAAAQKEEPAPTTALGCGTAGLPLIAGLFLAGMALLGGSKLKDE